MKKSYNKLMVVAIIFLIASLVLSCFSGNFFFNSQNISDLQVGVLLKLVLETTTTLLFGILIVTSLFSFLMVTVYQIIARLFQIGEEKKWKKNVGIVLTTISIITEILSSGSLIYGACALYSVMNVILLIIAAILSIIITIIFLIEIFKLVTEKKDRIILTTIIVIVPIIVFAIEAIRLGNL